MPDANIMSHSDHMTRTLFEIDKIVWRMSNNLIIVALHQACHNFFVKKPKIFENVKSERAAANFQKSQTPRASDIISKNSQI